MADTDAEKTATSRFLPASLSAVTGQQALGALFAIAFLASLLGLFVVDTGRSTFATLLVVMGGAVLVVALIPNLEEFVLGPTGVSAKLRHVEEKLDRQSEELARQQRIVNDLVIFSLAGQPYEILLKIEDGKEYLFDYYSEDHRRWGTVLLDGGLIEPRREKGEWLHFDEAFHRKNISEYAKTTPAGHFLVSLRERRT
jgi:Stage III sporulation protein AC/AD protein family